MPKTIETSEQRQQRLMRWYFEQSQSYGSLSRDDLVSIATMHPRFAHNAARKLVREAQIWAAAVGGEETGDDAILWMSTTPLFRALVDRARS